MKTWRSGLDYAFLGQEGVLVVMVGNQMLRMMEDIPEKVSTSASNTLAGITPEQPSSPTQSPTEKTISTGRRNSAETAAGGDSPTPLVDSHLVCEDGASVNDKRKYRERDTPFVYADFARDLERRLRVAVDALHYISKGYSGPVGNCEGHSGNHCAEHAREALRQIEGME